MLERLEIRNYVLIKNLVLDFSTGFAVITGETGSGKSIILGALSLILGEKARQDIVRQGEKEAQINALFSYSEGSAVDCYLKGKGLEGEDGGLFIQRVIRQNGRSIMSINGLSVNRSELEELGSLLVDVSSQHAHQSLLKKDVQLSLIDKASHAARFLDDYRIAYNAHKEAVKEKARLEEENEKILQELDYIRFCLDEMEKADVRPGEDEQLAEELGRISQAENLTQSLEETIALLRGGMEEGALSILTRAENAISKAARADTTLEQYASARADTTLEQYASRIEAAGIDLDDLASSLREYLSSFTFSEAELEEKSSRLALLQRLKKKYGGSLEALCERRDSYRERVDSAENFDDLIKDAQKKIETTKARLADLGSRLSKERRKSAQELEKTITSNLHELGLGDAVFHIEISQTEPSYNGMDDVVFTLAANKGEKAGPVSQVASGGELSRIMLAVKSALSGVDEVNTLLFDEIDAGLGGHAANVVAVQLEKLSRTHQVIAITHLAQIAAKAGTHFCVSKKEDAGRTISTIEEIEGEERIKEIARLLSGEVSDIAIEHARSLLEV